jgi:NADH-quinone oxidoreductase subunit A
MIGFSYFLGSRHKEPDTGKPYESGIEPTGSARVRYSIDYYLIAMFFVIFDLEAVFIIAWAIAFREVGWAGYMAVFLFIAILFAVLVYEWRMGALDFALNGKKVLRAYKKIKKKEEEQNEVVANESR